MASFNISITPQVGAVFSGKIPLPPPLPAAGAVPPKSLLNVLTYND